MYIETKSKRTQEEDHNISLIKTLMSSSNYREFLKKYIEFNKKFVRSFGYSELGRRAGFSSRSYPRDVIIGQKRITNSSLPRFIEAMELKGDIKVLFELLVQLEEPDTNLKELSKDQIHESIHFTLTRLHSRLINGTYKLGHDIIGDKYIGTIYASLGSINEGATLNEIAQRSKLSPAIIQAVLKKLMDKNLVAFNFETNRYVVHDYFALYNFHEDNEEFNRFFTDLLIEVSEKCNNKYDSERELFRAYCFSVSSDKLKALKTELNQVLDKYATDAETATGDCVAKLVVGMIANHNDKVMMMEQ